MTRFLLAFALLLPSSALAATGDALLRDLQLAADAVQADRSAEARQAEEQKLEAGNELFPLSVQDEREVRHGVEADPNVQVVIDGLMITMRDVPRDAWFAPYVVESVRMGILSGYREGAGTPLGLFGPADPVTIEQLAKIAALLAGIDEKSCASPVLNASAKGRWSERFVACAERAEWAVYSDGTVQATRPATRSEVVVTLLQAFGISSLKKDQPTFSDVPPSIQFSAFIERAAADGVVGGYTTENGVPTGLFGPFDRVDRAAMAKIIVNADLVYGNER